MNELTVEKKIIKTKVEEYLDIDETLVELEKDKDIIRFEINIVELPLFSKDTKRKKNEQKTYYFKHDKSAYVEIEPPDGYSIPGEFEERVFIALTKIMRNKNYNKKFIVTANEVLESLGVKNKIYYTKLKTALYSLSQTNYRFNNSLYSSSISGIIKDLILTHIMDVRIITRENQEYSEAEQFGDKRIKEIYQITFTDDFYNNIITKGYLAFDSELLLKIESSIARSLYTLIEKWRNYDLYLKRPAFFFARRVPLSWDKRQLKRTISIIEKALMELKELKLIKEFNIIKNKKWDLAEVEIIFDEIHNKIKKETFYAERVEFKEVELFITSTEGKTRIIDLDSQNAKEIISILPQRVQAMKTIEKFIEDSIKQYGFDYVLGTCEYVIMKKPTSFKAYLDKALKENFADEYIANKKSKEVKKVSVIEKEVIEEAKIIQKYSYENFEKLSDFEKDNIELKVYEFFLKESNSKDNKTMRAIFEKSKKSLIVKYMNENEVEVKHEMDSTEIVAEYISVSKFIVEVYKLSKEKNINFDFENIMPVFSFMKVYEDEFIKIQYDENTRIGKILYKGDK